MPPCLSSDIYYSSMNVYIPQHMFVTGLVARQRKGELQRVNEQLRQINAALRRQAKIESYAPALSYAPVGGSGRIPENEVIVDPRKEELISRLKAGKNFLRSQEHEKAYTEFKTALELAQNLKDPTEEKKAARGLGSYYSPYTNLFDMYIYMQMLGFVKRNHFKFILIWFSFI